MAYRSDLEAARARIRALEGELADARGEIAKLRKEAEAPEPDAPQPDVPEPEPERRRRGIRFDRPTTFFLPARLWFDGLKKLLAFCLRRRFDSPATGSVAVWLLYQLARPFVFVGRALAVLILVVSAPYTLLNAAIYSALLVPITAMACIRFSDAPLSRSWIRGDVDDPEVPYVYWLVTTFTPLVLPAGLVLGSVADAVL